MQLSNHGLQELNTLIKDKIIGLELRGSACIPWILAPLDYDIIIIVESKEKLIDLNHLLSYINKEINTSYAMYFRKKYHFCLHFQVGFIDKTILNAPYFYEILYRQTLLDYKLQPWLIDIYKEIKDRKHLFKITDEAISKFKGAAKSLYHIYTLKCIDENHSVNLTAEQIENINILHDVKNITDKEKYNLLVEECKNWLNN